MNLICYRWLFRYAVCVLCATASVLAAHAQASPTPTGEPEVLQSSAGVTEVGVLGRAEYRDRKSVV